MNRQETLNKAMAIVHGKREGDYGSPEDSFNMIAGMWSSYLGHELLAPDVAAMMALLKIARLRNDHTHEDSWVDLAGYAACGAECAAKTDLPFSDTKSAVGRECPDLSEGMTKVDPRMYERITDATSLPYADTTERGRSGMNIEIPAVEEDTYLTVTGFDKDGDIGVTVTDEEKGVKNKIFIDEDGTGALVAYLTYLLAVRREKK